MKKKLLFYHRSKRGEKKVETLRVNNRYKNKEIIFFSVEKKKLSCWLKMGCLKLTYREELPHLKVVSGNFSVNANSSVGVYR